MAVAVALASAAAWLATTHGPGSSDARRRERRLLRRPRHDFHLGASFGPPTTQVPGHVARRDVRDAVVLDRQAAVAVARLRLPLRAGAAAMLKSGGVLAAPSDCNVWRRACAAFLRHVV